MYSKTILITATICIALFAGMISCKKTDKTDYAANATCTGTTPTYTANIATILDANCASSGCHNASSAKAGIKLDNYANASDQFKNNNKNLIAIHHGNGVDAMPKGASQLSSTLINQLDCWVKNGCPQ